MNSHELLQIIGAVGDGFILEAARKPPRRGKARRILLLAALVALLTGAAIAASQSRLLDSLFQDEPPTIQAQQNIEQPGVSAASLGYSFRVTESLRDGDALHLDWEVENQTGETLIFYGPFIQTDARTYEEAWPQSLLTGGTILDTELPRCIARQGTYTLDGLPEQFSASVVEYVLRPKAQFVKSGVPGSTENTPTIIASLGDGDRWRVEDYCCGYTCEVTGDSAGFNQTRTHFDHSDIESEPYYSRLTSATDRRQAYVDVLCELGYVEQVERISLPLDFSRAAQVRTFLPENLVLEAPAYTLKILELHLGSVESTLSAELTPKGDFDVYTVSMELMIDGELVSAHGQLGGQYASDAVSFMEPSTGVYDLEFRWTSADQPPARIGILPRDADTLEWDYENMVEWVLS